MARLAHPESFGLFGHGRSANCFFECAGMQLQIASGRFQADDVDYANHYADASYACLRMSVTKEKRPAESGPLGGWLGRVHLRSCIKVNSSVGSIQVGLCWPNPGTIQDGWSSRYAPRRRRIPPAEPVGGRGGSRTRWGRPSPRDTSQAHPHAPQVRPSSATCRLNISAAEQATGAMLHLLVLTW